MIVLLTEPQEIVQSAIKLLLDKGHHVIIDSTNVNPKRIEALVIRTYVHADKEYLAKFPSLKFIIKVGVGLDNIDLEECRQRNITVVNSPGANALSVAEHSLSMMLILLKKIPVQQHVIRQGAWRDRKYLGSELTGKTVGLAGCGAVGGELARLLQAFSVKLIGYDKYVSQNKFSELGIKQVSLTELLAKSDLISVQIPSTPETIDMFTDAEFSQMKSSAYFINVSRGDLVNENDLVKALTLRTIAGAALDVTRNEPHPNPRLLAVDNLIITPHIASFTVEADHNMAFSAINRFLQLLEVQK